MIRHGKKLARRMAPVGTLLVLALAASAARAQSAPQPPCKDDPNYKQFDFLIGEWDVLRQGEKVAEVKWEPALAGCALIETWTATVPGRQNGMGMITWSRLRNSATYYYVGDQGSNTISDQAESKPNDITFIIRFPSPSGTGIRVRRFRLALQKDGSILESSVASDSGGPWTPEFELVWKKRKPQQ